MNPDEDAPTVEQLNERLLEHWRTKSRRYRKERNAYRAECDRLWHELFEITERSKARLEARDALHDQLEQARHELDEIRSERNYWRDATLTARRHRDGLGERLDTAENTLRIDGDLLADIIANQCPLWMTTAAARDLAEETVSELARYDDITVLRGTHSEPWTPDTETTNETNTCNAGPACTVDIAFGEEWTEYAVFVTAHHEGTICLVDGCTSEDAARALAQHVPGAWIVARRVVPEQWTTVTDP